ncbi:dephospho-CoA kinase [Klebsormidium nitens]|uniref:Dephospho-CoA kinase n=1 Tax=Klebsormidium nitens TaxID=105231 RepID=A0A1Y1HRD4_KLENI|nr:dephospho-CoA kinase [Klebsormidium nitens]|eukprot:GAQ78388.1 dephospho-CoA kinase [Klebsormidium nitens]
MRIVGLTGNIACGKSWVSGVLAAKGAPIIDADKISHDAAKRGTPGYRRVVKAFGTDFLQPDGELDRQRLGNLVFQDQAKRKKLNSILQPLIGIEIARQLAWHWLRGCRVVILDAPLLFEAKISWLTKPIVVVSCNEETQLQRLRARDGLSEQQARDRINSQLPLTWKEARADVIINNSGTREETRTQVDALWQKINGRQTFFQRITSRNGLLFAVGILVVGLKILR